jgi:single-strand DNA-binding protein
MARSVNRIILIGNAGSDPDLRETSGGTAVAHLSLATDRRTRRNGEEEQKTDWHRLTFWGKSSELAVRLVRRGSRLYVEGRLEYGSYEREGVEIPTADVIVHDFVVLDAASDAAAPAVEEAVALL